MAKKVYAVKRGLKTGLFYSWDECQSAIKGYSGAEFKGFNSEEEAFAYMNGSSIGVSRNIDRPKDGNTVNIFTLGTFKNSTVTFGIYMQTNNKDIKLCGALGGNGYNDLRNIAGELIGVLSSIQVAVQLGYTNIDIYYSYQGVEDWCIGNWRAKGELQQKYVSLMNSLRVRNNLNYNFHSIKEYGNNTGSSIVNKLSLRALNLGQFIDDEKVLRGTCTIDDLFIAPL